ncbi:MAG: coproporphyrinogen III oxidase [Alphaproteobacteria bacterium]|nr:coproporphyrinogen III oxidase [Alphaproteobacteria bacterium]
MNNKGRLGLYIHWPFCLSKCPYCDFNVHVRNAIDYGRWQDTYLKSLDYYATIMPERLLGSIYFGGGTPSTMPPALVGAIIDKARSIWPCTNDIEITLEANPTSIEMQKFEAFKEAGVNRVSIGVQALNDKDLQFLGRQHSAKEALKAVGIARDVFEKFSFDLIYARPEQTLDQWQEELSQARELAGGHLSLYQLTIERNTPFYYSYEQKQFSLPEEELAADFYDLTQELLNEDLPAYEVSNHAADGQESQHNLNYWHNGEYVGIGPGAHGRIWQDGVKCATRNHHAPDAWLERVEGQGHGAHPYQKLKQDDLALEALMTGLRLREGLCLEHLAEQSGGDWQSYIDMAKLDMIIAEGWAVQSKDALTLTREGMLRLNAIIPFILKAGMPHRKTAR